MRPHKDNTHCHRGHALTPDNIKISSAPKKSGDGHYQTRSCLTCLRAMQRRNSEKRRKHPIAANEDQVRRVIAGLREGKSLRNLCSGSVGHVYVPGLFVVSIPKLRAFRLQHPKVDKMITKLAASTAKAQWDAGQARRWEGQRRSAISVIRSADIFHEIRDAVPAYTFDREEVIATMALALVEGRLQRRDIARRVPEFMRAQSRMFSKFIPGGGIMGSLNMPAYREGATPLIETISRGLWQ